MLALGGQLFQGSLPLLRFIPISLCSSWISRRTMRSLERKPGAMAGLSEDLIQVFHSRTAFPAFRLSEKNLAAFPFFHVASSTAQAPCLLATMRSRVPSSELPRAKSEWPYL